MVAWIGNRDPMVELVRCPFCGAWIAESENGNPFLRECGDCDDLDLFSDLYKDRHGVRPRGFSADYARRWLAVN